MRKSIFILFLMIVSLLLQGCFDKPNVAGRWYTQSQVNIGTEVYKSSCAVCHGVSARGKLNWRKQLADGTYPPPPLDGTAHTWHHSLAQLKRQIRNGSVQLGGQMPAFSDQLSAEEIEAVIAFIQSQWSDRIYQSWAKRNRG